MSLLTSLISYWPLDEASGNALDAHGTNDLTDNNTVGSATGKVGNARDFEDGSSEYFDHTSNSDLQTGDIDFSVACWVQLESLTTYRAFVSKQHEYRLIYDVGGDRLQFTVENVGGTAGIAQGTSAPSTGVWYFLVGVHDSVNNLVKLSINGGAFITSSFSDGASATANPFYIGRAEFFGTKLSDGLIDEVGFWKKCLTIEEVEDLYNDGHGLAYTAFSKPDSPSAELTDGLLTYHAFETGSGTTSEDSHSSNDGTLNAGVSWASGQVGGGVSFDGSDDNITIPAIAAITGLTEISVMVWAKPLSAGGASFGRIFHSDDVNPFGLLMNSASNSVQWLINGGSGLSVGAVTASAWNFIIGTYDSVALRVYVAGALAGSGAYTSVLNACSTIYLSDRSSTGRAFEGSMDEAAIWSRRLTPWERRYLYNSGAGRTYTDFAGGAAAPAATPSLFGIINNPVAMGF